jgi:hypothetical protein
MYTDKNSANKWIVKSENRILGPYNFEQIEDLIQKKQISLIDEVRDSETRWLYVRENPSFRDIVDSIRKELDSKLESTKTYQSFSKTEDISKTKTEIPNYTDVQMEVQDIPVVKEIIQNVQQEKEQQAQEDLGKREKVKLYGLAQDEVVKNKVQSSSNQFLIYVFALFIFLVGSTTAMYFYQRYNQQKQEELWAQQIKKYKFLGLEKKAVEVYKRLPAENQKAMLPQVIELLPLLEASGMAQAQEIESLKNNSDLNIEQKANLQLVLFGSAMQTQDFKLAQEHIVKASTLQPASSLIKENDALVNLKTNHYQKAMDIYFELYRKESSGRYLFGLVISLMGLPKGEREARMSEVSQLIEKYTFVYYDYKKELLLAKLLFSKLEKNEALFQNTWKQFISTPCQLSSLFKAPLLLAPKSYQWKDLADYSSLLRSYLSPEELVLFEVHNLIESDQISAASQYNNQNGSKIKDVLVRQQMNMLIYHFQSRFSDVLALEKTNQIDLQSELNQVLLALDKLEENPNVDLSNHMKYFTDHQLVFYHDWIQLAQLIKLKSLDSMRTFTRNHFLTVNNFTPALEAKSMVE